MNYLWGSTESRAAAGTKKCKKSETQCAYSNLYEKNDFDVMIDVLQASIANADSQINHIESILRQLKAQLDSLPKDPEEPVQAIDEPLLGLDI